MSEQLVAKAMERLESKFLSFKGWKYVDISGQIITTSPDLTTKR